MPRQNFISKDFFANISEQDARLSLLQLTQYSPALKFIKENTLTQSFRFLYQPTESKKHYQLDISLLPLDSTYTQVCLHLAYTNGQALTTDAGAKTILMVFEQAIQALMRGETASPLLQPTVKANKGWNQWFSIPITSWLLNQKKRIANI
jgi:hypothetical protein